MHVSWLLVARKLIAEAWDGSILRWLGDLDRGLRQLQHVSAGLPLEPLLSYCLAEAYILARDFTRAADASRDALELHPNLLVHPRDEPGKASRCLAITARLCDTLRWQSSSTPRTPG